MSRTQAGTRGRTTDITPSHLVGSCCQRNGGHQTTAKMLNLTPKGKADQNCTKTPIHRCGPASKACRPPGDECIPVPDAALSTAHTTHHPGTARRHFWEFTLKKYRKQEESTHTRGYSLLHCL